MELNSIIISVVIFIILWSLFWNLIFPKIKTKYIKNERLIRLRYERETQKTYQSEIITFSLLIAGITIIHENIIVGGTLLVIGCLAGLTSSRYSGFSEREYLRLKELILKGEGNPKSILRKLREIILKIKKPSSFTKTIILIIIAWIVSKIVGFFNPVVAAICYIIIVVVGFLYIAIKEFKKEIRSPGYFLFSVALIIITVIWYFTIAFMLPPSETSYIKVNGNITNLNFPEALYFSIVTLTTLGYGDVVPYGIFRSFSSLEAILGFILLGIFVSSLVTFTTNSKKN